MHENDTTNNNDFIYLPMSVQLKPVLMLTATQWGNIKSVNKDFNRSIIVALFVSESGSYAANCQPYDCFVRWIVVQALSK